MAEGRIGRFRVDADGAIDDGGDLGDVERRLLRALWRRAPDVVPRDVLVAELWPEGLPAGSRALDMAWSRLRRRVDDEAAFRTVRGGGYAVVPARGGAEGGSAGFVGYGAQLARVRAWLDQRGPWLTITGIGGMGKTRLATEVARGQPRAVWVDLAAFDEDEAAVRHVAERLGVALAPGAAAEPAIAVACARRSVLLFLDNVEQVRGAARRLAQAFADAPGVRVVATSRQRLGVPSERVEPLSGLSATDARALYVRLVRASFVDPDPAALDEALVELVCTAADGHPLTLELAVATLRRRPPALLAAALQAGATRLRGERTGRVARHASFHDVFEHSWAPLDADDRRALAALSLFAGRFAAEDAESLLGVAPASIRSLVDQSLVALDRGAFGLHPLIRELARARLAAMDPEGAIRRSFRRTLLGWLGETAPRLRVDDPDARAAIAGRVADLTAAFEDAAAHRDEAAVAAGWPGARSWVLLRGEARTGARWAEAALRAVETPALRGDVAAVLADAWIAVGRAPEARDLLEPVATASASALVWGALAHARGAVGDFPAASAAVAEATARLGEGDEAIAAALLAHDAWRALGRRDLGDPLAARALALARDAGNAPLLRRALTAQAAVHMATARYPESVATASEAATLAAAADDRAVALTARTVLAVSLRWVGRGAEGLELLRALQEEAVAQGLLARVGFLQQQEAVGLLDVGDLARAEEVLRRALVTAERHGTPIDRSNTLLQLANVYCMQRRFDESLATIAQRREVTEQAGLTDGYNRVLNAQGQMPSLLAAGRNAEARAALVEARALAANHGLAEAVWWANALYAAVIEATDGDVARAAEAGLEALGYARTPWLVLRSLFLLGLATARLGERSLAAGLLPLLREARCSEREGYLWLVEAAVAGAEPEPLADVEAARKRVVEVFERLRAEGPVGMSRT